MRPGEAAMDEAAPQAAEAGAAEDHALEALRLEWGEFYLIGYDDERGWYAARRGLIGVLLTGEGPGELRAAMADEQVLARA
jgi:hypothetical protein